MKIAVERAGSVDEKPAPGHCVKVSAIRRRYSCSNLVSVSRNRFQLLAQKCRNPGRRSRASNPEGRPGIQDV